LIDSLNKSYCDTDFFNKIRREINQVRERIPTDYESHYETLKMQMLKIKENIKKESLKIRCSYLKNSITTMRNERQDQNSREELLAIDTRLSNLEGHITNSSSSSHFEQIES
jgi:hypothetical protein